MPGLLDNPNPAYQAQLATLIKLGVAPGDAANMIRARSGGTGGGLSPQAVMQSMAPQQAPAVPYGMGSLPANPLMNPQAILEAQMRAIKGY